MNENSNIPFQDFRQDFSLLEKFKSQEKIWGELKPQKGRRSRRLRTNFVLHPRKLHSDSSNEDSSSIRSDSSPEKYNFCSPTVVKSLCKIADVPKSKVRNVLTETNSIKEVPPLEVNKIGDFDSTTPVFGKTSLQNSTRPEVCSLDPFEKKYKMLAEKSIKAISDIKNLMEKGIPPPDGEDDCLKRHKRLQEFSSRFARIYVYPTLRQTNELSVPDKLTPPQINQKILSAQQTILQGLQAYFHHLPTSTGNCCADKLKNLLSQEIYLCQIASLMRKSQPGDIEEFINALCTHTEILDESVDVFMTKRMKPVKKSASHATLDEKKRKLSESHQKNVKKQGRYSMYGETASFRRDLPWKKAVESLAKKKFAVTKSRYKTATFKHRPPPSAEDKPHLMELPNKNKLFPKRSSGLLKNTPLASPKIKEDNIKTMVEGVIDEENQGNEEDSNQHVMNHEEVAAKILKLVRDSDRGAPMPPPSSVVALSQSEICENFDGGVEKALDFLRNQGHDFLVKVAQEISRQQSQQQLEFVVRREPSVVSITGSKNAQLICIKDDNSLIEDDEDDNNNKKIDKEIMTEREIISTASATQTDLRSEENVSKKTKVKISRLPKKNLKVLELLPRNYAISIIQYKLEFHKFCKHNHMYKKNSQIHPWVLMGKVSDEILDNLLLTVSKELEVNEILENLYQSEFQY